MQDMQQSLQQEATQTKKHLSDDAADSIAAVVLIALLVSGVVYWLQSMP